LKAQSKCKPNIYNQKIKDKSKKLRSVTTKSRFGVDKSCKGYKLCGAGCGIWLVFIAFLSLGILLLTQYYGFFIAAVEGALRIKWRNWFREVIIHDKEIEKIILAKVNILIIRKGKNPVKLLFDSSLEIEQKTKVYEFLIE
jgi:hypothetical protein